MVTTKTLLTAADLWRVSHQSDSRYELVKGELVEMAPVGVPHGRLQVLLGGRLNDYCDAHGLGITVVEVGFYLEKRPDTVRAPDVAFIAAARVPSEGLPEGYFPGAPDLAVEIVSPGDTSAVIAGKVQDYLAHGTRLVWVVDLRARTIHVHRHDGTEQLLCPGDKLSGEDVVPGFSLPVAELLG